MSSARSVDRGGPVCGRRTGAGGMKRRERAGKANASGASASGPAAMTLGAAPVNTPGHWAMRWARQQGQSTASICGLGATERAQHGSARTSCIRSQKKYREPARAVPENIEMASTTWSAIRA